MSDAMMEAHRDNERRKAEEELTKELVACAADYFDRHRDELLRLAHEVDDIRGGMVGTTNYAARIEDRCLKLYQRDETEWIRLLDRLRTDPVYIEEGDTHVDLYDRAKKYSPFDRSILLFAFPKDSPEMARYAKASLNSLGYDRSMDSFAYELTWLRHGIQLRPIWVRPIVHRPGEPRSTSPYINKEPALL